MTAPWSPDGGMHQIPLATTPGRLWLCGKQAVAPDVEATRRRLPVDTVVCLVERHEISERYPLYTAWLERHAEQEALWFPVPDLGAPSLARALQWLDTIGARLEAGEGVLMHCAAGRGRAGTLAVGLMLRAGLDRDDAIACVRQHRPGAGPEAGSQMALIEQLAAAYGAATNRRAPHH